MESDDAGAVGLHDEVAAIGFAVLEFVGHEGLEVEDFLEALAPQVPDVEAAGMLGRAYADGDVHAAAKDAGALPYLLRGEAGVEVLDAVVVEGIGGIEVHLRALAEGRKGERHYAPAVALGEVLDGVAIAYEEAATVVDDPLQGVAEEAIGIIEDDGLHELRLGVETDALDETDVLESVVALARALRDIEEREGIFLGVALNAETGDIGVVGLMVAGEGELPQAFHAVGTEAVDGSYASVLQADEVVAIDAHALVALARNALERSPLPHVFLSVVNRFAGEEKEEYEAPYNPPAGDKV